MIVRKDEMEKLKRLKCFSYFIFILYNILFAKNQLVLTLGFLIEKAGKCNYQLFAGIY